MVNKLTVVFVVGIIGASVGAMLGYGPLLRYKTEGVISMDMGTAEYKRFTELANDFNTFEKFASLNPPAGVDAKGIVQLARFVEQGQWHKPVPRVSKADAKELPDILLQIEQDRERDREKTSDDVRKPAVATYLGLRLNYVANDANKAANVAAWLGGYVKDVAASEAVREQVARWKVANLQFTDRAREQKLKHEFTIEQAQARVAALKKVVATYPESKRRESSQVVDVRKDNEKFMSPQAQLIGAESEIIEIHQKVGKLNRELEQQLFTQILIKDIELALNKSRSGAQAVLGLSAVLNQYGNQVKSNAEREKLLSLTADLSQISSRFLSQAQFISVPSVPATPERPGPLVVATLGGLLAALVAGLFVWRKLIIRFLSQDDA